MRLFNIIFGKKKTVTVVPPSEIIPLTATNWQPSPPIILTGGSTVFEAKPAPLMVPFTKDISYLDPRMRKDIPEFLRIVEDAGLELKLSCTARLFKCQVALYAQGRQPLAEVNRLRKLAGMQPILTAVEAKKKVTWTLVSKHLVNFDDTDPNNDYSQAFDFFLISKKKAYWDVKANVNNNQIADYQEVGEIAESFGWEWGGRWKKKPDYPHIQLKA